MTSVLFISVAQSRPTLRPHESQHARPPCLSQTPHDISYHDSKNWNQRNRNRLTGDEDLLYLKQSRWHWPDHCVTDFKKTVKVNCCFCMYSPLTPPIHSWDSPLKGLAHSLLVRLWPLDTSLPLPVDCQSPKQSKPSLPTNLALEFQLSSAKQLYLAFGNTWSEQEVVFVSVSGKKTEFQRRKLGFYFLTLHFWQVTLLF